MKVTKRFPKRSPYERYELRFYNQALKGKCLLNCMDRSEAIREKNRLMKLPHLKNVVLFEID